MGPRPHFFLVRPDTKTTTANGQTHMLSGPIVPLVALDELPDWLDIVGVPRHLTVEQTVGLGNLGTVSKTSGRYAIKIIHEATPGTATSSRQLSNVAVRAADKSPNGDAIARTSYRADLPQAPVAASARESPRRVAFTTEASTAATHHPAELMRKHWTETHALSPAAAANSNPTRPQSAQPPSSLPVQQLQTHSPRPPQPPRSTSSNDTVDTEYCRHWCHHGTCKWGLQCHYLHAMPTTPSGLADVGLQTVPDWWMAVSAGGIPPPPSHPDTVTIAGSGSGNGAHPTPVFDHRDVRAGGAQRLIPSSTPAPSGVVGSNGNNGNNTGNNIGSNNNRNKATRAKTAQLLEAVALLGKLGLLGGGGGNGGGRSARRMAVREVNPLQKGPRQNVVLGKEATLTGASASGLAGSMHAVAPQPPLPPPTTAPHPPISRATAAPAGTSGQVGCVQPAGVEIADGKQVAERGKMGCAELAAPGNGAAADTRKMGKLVDV